MAGARVDARASTANASAPAMGVHATARLSPTAKGPATRAPPARKSTTGRTTAAQSTTGTIASATIATR